MIHEEYQMTGERAEKAVKLFEEGFVCSQAVLAAFCDLLEIEENMALKISNGFGGGIARKQEVCGAVSGGIMAIGLKYGRAELDDMAAHEKTYKAIHAFCDEFERKNGFLNCRNLLGCDMKEAREKGLFDTLCKQYVGSAAQILEVYWSKAAFR
jgi:C_GCAxxG_C_C family probable redox protein